MSSRRGLVAEFARSLFVSGLVERNELTRDRGQEVASALENRWLTFRASEVGYSD